MLEDIDPKEFYNVRGSEKTKCGLHTRVCVY